MLRNLFFSILLSVSLIGCAGLPQQPVSTTLPDIATPEAESVAMQGYTWKVYKRDDILAVAEDLKANPQKPFVIFAMTPDGYKKMTSNYGELQRYIKEQKAIIVYLKTEISGRSK